MSDRPFSMEPEPGNRGSEPVERLGLAGTRAAHFEAFSRPSEEPPAIFPPPPPPAREVKDVEVVEATGWFPATARTAAGEARPTPRAAVVLAESPIQHPSPTIDNAPGPHGSMEPHRDHLGRVEPSLNDFSYAGIQQPNDFDIDDIFPSGTAEVDPGELNNGLSNITSEPAPHYLNEETPSEDGLLTSDDDLAPQTQPYSFDDHDKPRSKTSAFLLKNANYLIYSVGGLAALLVVYWMIPGGHHSQPPPAFAPAAGLTQLGMPNQTGEFSPGGQGTAFPSSSLTNPQQPQGNALPTAQPAQAQQPLAQTTLSPTVPAPPPVVDTVSAPAAAPAKVVPSPATGSDVASTISTPPLQQASQATVSPVQGMQQPSAEQESGASPAPAAALGSVSEATSNTGTATVPAQVAGLVHVAARQDTATATAPAFSRPAVPVLPTATVVGQAQTTQLISQLGQISTAVSSLNSKFSAQQSDENETIQQMSDKISSLQQSLLTLETKIAISEANATHNTAAAPAPQKSTTTETQLTNQAGANVAAQNNVTPSQIAQMPVIPGYDLRGYSQDAVVVGTPYGTSTVRINETVPGAGRALGLYQYGPGSQGIELVTDQGVIRPSPTGGN